MVTFELRLELAMHRARDLLSMGEGTSRCKDPEAAIAGCWSSNCRMAEDRSEVGVEYWA